MTQSLPNSGYSDPGFIGLLVNARVGFLSLLESRAAVLYISRQVISAASYVF